MTRQHNENKNVATGHLGNDTGHGPDQRVAKKTNESCNQEGEEKSKKRCRDRVKSSSKSAIIRTRKVAPSELLSDEKKYTNEDEPTFHCDEMVNKDSDGFDDDPDDDSLPLDQNPTNNDLSRDVSSSEGALMHQEENAPPIQGSHQEQAPSWPPRNVVGAFAVAGIDAGNRRSSRFSLASHRESIGPIQVEACLVDQEAEEAHLRLAIEEDLKASHEEELRAAHEDERRLAMQKVRRQKRLLVLFILSTTIIIAAVAVPTVVSIGKNDAPTPLPLTPMASTTTTSPPAITTTTPSTTITSVNGSTIPTQPTNEYFQLLDSSQNGCDSNLDVSETECLDAAISLGGVSNESITGGYVLAMGGPPGCSILSGGDSTVHYNYPVKNDGSFLPVCKGSYTLLNSSQNGCDTNLDVSETECLEAATSLGGVAGNGSLITGTWQNAPPGCSIQSGDDDSIYYNRDVQNASNDGNYLPVCKGAWLLLGSSSNGCDTGFDVSESECLEAAFSLGGEAYEGKIESASWWWASVGCSIQNDPLYKTIYYNKYNPHNDGNYSSVCKRTEVIPKTSTSAPPISTTTTTATFPAPHCNQYILVDNETYKSVCIPNEAGTDFQLLDSSQNGCDSNLDVLETECLDAAISLGGVASESWTTGYVPGMGGPLGCSILSGGDNTVHYNYPVKNEGYFLPVCKGPYTLLNSSQNGCDTNLDVSETECLEVAGNGSLITGTWQNAPPGCSIQSGDDDSIYYNRDVQNASNDGNYLPVCKGAWVLLGSSNNGCDTGFDVSESECLEAAFSLGGEAYEGQIESASWWWASVGCSIQNDPSYKTIYYNKYNPHNDGNYSSVCKRQYIFDEASQNVCDTTLNVSQIACLEAGISLGGKSWNEKLVLGSWYWIPQGCSVQTGGDNAIYYNKYTPNSDRSYSPVCKVEYELLGDGECLQADGQPGMRFSIAYHDLSIDNDDDKKTATKRCQEVCRRNNQWCKAVQMTIAPSRKMHPYCDLITDQALFEGAGNSFKGYDWWGYEQIIDGSPYQTFCGQVGDCESTNLGGNVTLGVDAEYQCYVGFNVE